MLKMKKFWLALAAVAALGSLATAQFDIKLGDIIKVGGIGLLVDKFGPEINKAANGIQGFKSSEQQMTKVVPIISVGQGGYIGAAQVMGPPAQVKRVKYLAQVEGKFSGNAVRIKALVPVESKDVVKNLKRVVGVGVSAVIDIKI